MDHDTTKKRVHRAILQSQQMIGLKDQLSQHPQHKLEDCHRFPQPPIQTQTTRIHQNAITPMDPPKHLLMAKAQVLPNQRRHRQMQIQLLSLLTLSYVLDVTKVATGAKNCPHHNFCDFCRVTTHTTHMCRATKHGPDHQSVFTVANLITVLLIVGTDPRTTGKSLDRHQML